MSGIVPRTRRVGKGGTANRVFGIAGAAPLSFEPCQLIIRECLPCTFGVLLCTSLARRQVLDARRLEPPTSIARGKDGIPSGEFLYARSDDGPVSH